MNTSTWLVVIVAVIIGIYAPYSYIQLALRTANGFAAKITCTVVFESGRSVTDASQLYETELLGIFKYLNIDIGDKTVSSSMHGWHTRYAYHRDGVGCVLARPETAAPPKHIESLPDLAARTSSPDEFWPRGNRINTTRVRHVIDGVDMHALSKAMSNAFAESESSSASLKSRKNTRAVLVVYRGEIIAERYAPGFNANTKLAGWSMTKSILNALVGVLVRQGKLSVSDTIDAAEWANDDDDRRKSITIEDALRMSTGLEFNEAYHPLVPQDPSVMLFATADGDTAHYAALKPSQHPRGTHWSYASGTTNLLSRRIRQVFATHAEYAAFVRRDVFDRIDTPSFVVETDASGTFVGSSFSMATTRDWARFGLLYGNDGVWNGERVLPEGWVDSTRAPVPASNANERYGLHWWLGGTCDHHTKQTNNDDDGGAGGRRFPEMPCDAFLAHGYEAQAVVVVPSSELVVVRLGVTKVVAEAGIGQLVADIVAALP